MSISQVFWHEGMFLRPHQFQTAERYLADQLRLSGKFDVHHNWGVRHIEIDEGALRNYRFEVHKLFARMRDGTMILAERGTDLSVDPLDLKRFDETLGPGETVDILLAVPTLQLGKPNTAGPEEQGARYHIDMGQEEIPDENSGQNLSQVPIRRLNVKRLLTSEDNLSGFETLPLARLMRSSQASAPLQLHPEYIPPVLSCDGWKALDIDIVKSVYNRIGGLVKTLARQVKDQGIKFDTNNPDQRKIFERLRTLNEAYAAFGVLAQTVGVHPFQAYLELCRIVGQLSAFSRDATLPDELPVYDHDDLGRCFYTVKRWIDDLLSGDINTGYEVRPFRGEGLRMRVKIEPHWLAPACHLLVGVESVLSPEACAKLMTGRLNMKIGAFERVDEIFIRGLRGLDFVHDHKPPSVLPTPPTITYFRINRESSREEWNAVNQSYNLAVRLNEKLLTGSIDNKQEVTIQADSKTVSLKITLYVVLPASS